MAIAKGAGGYVFNSQALIADGVHALTDLVSDITTLATISYSLKPPTSRFPLGYGKVESLGALGVSGLLLTGGIMIGLQAVLALCQQFFPGIAHVLSDLGIFEHIHDHGHHHGAASVGPNINAAWVAAGSIIVKEWLYRATIKIARQKRSSVLASNAYHHRVDSLTSIVALVTIVASNFLTSAQWLDPVGGLAISGMIVQAGWGNTKAALLELSDVAMDEEVRDKVDQTARAALQEYFGSDAELRGVQGVKSGQNFLVDLEVFVAEDMSIGRAEEVEGEIRQRVTSKVRGVRRLAVRFTSKDKGREAFSNEYVAGRLGDTVEEHSHDDHDHANGHTESKDKNEAKRR
ncbi:mitochondrial metal transporter [Recurvomyces mirabilis]|uniref:Mitochondrial metal transporter n=1 Tax=Recurvomyces mirabilis TaxID=574656 RepID=A0AAE0WP52_9PEZI|nr:mitochondrial metal transporter [Recurvomyces mirabilis]KAK5158049.1 mitochondrial metal transporter [Recurvomyces mirabilis]